MKKEGRKKVTFVVLKGKFSFGKYRINLSPVWTIQYQGRSPGMGISVHKALSNLAAVIFFNKVYLHDSYISI